MKSSTVSGMSGKKESRWAAETRSAGYHRIVQYRFPVSFSSPNFAARATVSRQEQERRTFSHET